MSEFPTPVFADQVCAGMTIEHPSPASESHGRVLVTQVRSEKTETTTVVTILGVFDDGRPFDYFCGANMVWHVHETQVTP